MYYVVTVNIHNITATDDTAAVWRVTFESGVTIYRLRFLLIALTFMVSSGYRTRKVLIKHTRACSFFIYDTRKIPVDQKVSGQLMITLYMSGAQRLFDHPVWITAAQVYSVQQKSIGLKFSKSRTGSDVRYSCHHNSSRFTRTFPIFAHSWRFFVFHSLQSITPRIY